MRIDEVVTAMMTVAVSSSRSPKTVTNRVRIAGWRPFSPASAMRKNEQKVVSSQAT